MTCPGFLRQAEGTLQGLIVQSCLVTAPQVLATAAPAKVQLDPAKARENMELGLCDADFAGVKHARVIGL